MGFKLEKYFKIIKEKGKDAGFNYKAQYIPDTIYKFYPLYDEYDIKGNKIITNIEKNKKRLSSLENNKIWFSSPKKQNDPYEYKGFYISEKYLLGKGFPKELISSFEKVFNNVFFSSFTENAFENIPMWAHYSNNHKGYCVKYTVNNKNAIFKVQYVNKRFDISKIIDIFLKNFYDGYVKKIKSFDEIVKDQAVFLLINCYIKHSSWEYEKEYRIIYADINDDEILGENVSIEELGLKCSGIYCGISCSKEHYKRLNSIAKTLGVECKKCSTNDEQFIFSK